MLLSPKQTERFWSKVNRGSPDQCWPWTAIRNSKGYGRFSLRGRQLTASRLAWQLANGAVMPADKLACHTCDNPPCCNPAHLWVGSPSDNQFDCVNKGRRITRKTHCSRGHALTEDNVRRVNRGKFCRTCDANRPKRFTATVPGVKKAISALRPDEIAAVRAFVLALAA